MKKMNFLIVLNVLMGSLLTVFLVACDSEETDKSDVKSIESDLVDYYSDIGEWKVPKQLISGKRKRHLARPAIKIINNKVAVLYSLKNSIVFQYDENDVVLDATKGAKKLWLYGNAKNIYALWWRKLKDGGKKLYIRTSSDSGVSFSKAAIVNSSTGILPSVSLVSDGAGNIAVSYYDERQPPYRIYLNYSSDNGITWNSQDMRIDNDADNSVRKMGDVEIPQSFAINPNLIHLESGRLVLIWQQRKVINGRVRSQFVQRISTDFGKSWEEEHVIYSSTMSLTVEYEVDTNGGNILLVAAYPKKGLLGFWGTESLASKGLSWVDLGAVKGTENVNEISWLRPVISNNGTKTAYIIEKDAGVKYHIEVANVDVKKAKWGEVFRVDRVKNKNVDTKATYFDLKSLPNGEFAIAWEDYKNLIPTLLFDYTEDKGKNWRKKPIELTRGGLSQIRYPNLFVALDKLMITFEWDISRDRTFPRLSYMQIPLDKTGSLSKVIAAPLPKKILKKERKAMLKKMVAQFMDYRVKKEWEKTWGFMDPIYQMVTNKRSWLSNMGYVTYEKYNIGRIIVDDKFATVNLDMTISLPQQFREGELMEPSPPKKSKIETKWLWFYDRWYFYPSSTFQPHLNY